MMLPNLNDKNFLQYAMKHYDNPHCHDIDEFNEDLRRFSYIKKLITRSLNSNDFKDKLIMNHLIVLNNVFGPLHLNRMLCVKLFDQLKYITPFLLYMNILPDIIYNITDRGDIYIDTIPMDPHVIEIIRNIKC